jgi:predicted ATPase
LFGLWAMHLFRAEFRTARELAEEFLRRTQSAGDPALLLYAHYILGNTLYWIGELLSARQHFETAISLYDRERHHRLTFRYEGIDGGVMCLSYAAATMWQLGYPDLAEKMCHQALALAQELSHPHSLVGAEMWLGVLHQYRREAIAAEAMADSVVALSAEHGLTDFSALATILRGWAIAEQERNEEGIAQIQEGLVAFRATGAEIGRPYFLSLFAEACGEKGHIEEALSALMEALGAVKENEERFFEPEIHRLRGELLLRHDAANAVEAESCFCAAIEVARRRSAKSFELRASTSLARLLNTQGRRDDARAMLANIYNWFTEGFDTTDLKDAKALLDELSEDQ